VSSGETQNDLCECAGPGRRYDDGYLAPPGWYRWRLPRAQETVKLQARCVVYVRPRLNIAPPEGITCV
jgi:hypothetical protein